MIPTANPLRELKNGLSGGQTGCAEVRSLFGATKMGKPLQERLPYANPGNLDSFHSRLGRVAGATAPIMFPRGGLYALRDEMAWAGSRALDRFVFPGGDMALPYTFTFVQLGNPRRNE